MKNLIGKDSFELSFFNLVIMFIKSSYIYTVSTLINKNISLYWR